MHDSHGSGYVPPEGAKIEPTDISMDGIGRGVRYFFAFTFLTLLACWGITVGAFKLMEGPKRAHDAPLQMKPSENMPMLQTNISAKTDIFELRREEAQRKASYGKGMTADSAQIPIDKAIDAIAAKGIHVVEKVAPATAKPAETVPAEGGTTNP